MSLHTPNPEIEATEERGVYRVNNFGHALEAARTTEGLAYDLEDAANVRLFEAAERMKGVCESVLFVAAHATPGAAFAMRGLVDDAEAALAAVRGETEAEKRLHYAEDANRERSL